MAKKRSTNAVKKIDKQLEQVKRSNRKKKSSS